MSGRQSAATDKALRLIARGLTPYAAAKKLGLALSTVYRAQKRSNTMTARDFAAIYGFSLGTAKASTVQRIMQAGELVQPELAYDLTGKPDQYLTIPQALELAGCTRD